MSTVIAMEDVATMPVCCNMSFLSILRRYIPKLQKRVRICCVGTVLTCRYDSLSKETGSHLLLWHQCMPSIFAKGACRLSINTLLIATPVQLKPTAGYPADADRFLADIAELVDHEKIKHETSDS